MADAVIFSDIMAHLVSRITAALIGSSYSTATVSVQASEDLLAVVLRQEGGVKASKTIKSTIIGVNIFAPSFADAEGLSLLIEGIFDDLPDGNPVTSVAPQSSIQDVTDLKGQRRFMRFSVNHRGSNLP